jgi:hypothetical protein
MKSKLKIYANGDSHSDGAGLADPETFPDSYPGHITELPMKVNADWCILRNSIIFQDETVRKLSNTNNRKYVWGTVLGELVDATVVNNSVSGSCMLGIATRTIADLEIMKKSNSLPTHVFIGLTEVNRLSLYNIPDIYELKKTTDWVHSVVPRMYHTGHSKQYKKLFELTWATLNDDDFIISYLRECLLIKNYVNSCIGKDPIFLNTNYIFYRYSDMIYNSQNKWLQMLWFDLLEFDKINKKCFNAKDGFTSFTACGHLLPEAHQDFAKELAREHFDWTN